MTNDLMWGHNVLQAGRFGVRTRCGQSIFCSPHQSRPCPAPNQPHLYKKSFLGVRRPECGLSSRPHLTQIFKRVRSRRVVPVCLHGRSEGEVCCYNWIWIWTWKTRRLGILTVKCPLFAPWHMFRTCGTLATCGVFECPAGRVGFHPRNQTATSLVETAVKVTHPVVLLWRELRPKKVLSTERTCRTKPNTAESDNSTPVDVKVSAIRARILGWSCTWSGGALHAGKSRAVQRCMSRRFISV